MPRLDLRSVFFLRVNPFASIVSIKMGNSLYDIVISIENLISLSRCSSLYRMGIKYVEFSTLAVRTFMSDDL